MSVLATPSVVHPTGSLVDPHVDGPVLRRTVAVVDPSDLDMLLTRVGLARSEITLDLVGLSKIQHAMLVALPLHDLHLREGTTPEFDAYDVIVRARDGLGNWRFGANIALAAVLRDVGFSVAVSGAALLSSGPNRLVDHIVLDVSAPGLGPHLVDVGLTRAPVEPLRLNSGEVQRLGHHDYRLMASPQGTTLTIEDDGVPTALFRFRRVAHDVADFTDTIVTARSLQHGHDGPVATRLLDRTTFDRVVVSPDRLEFERGAGTERHELDDWRTALTEWFPTLTWPR